ncbi:hypothetical protein [Halalkalicoccus salilacus]|uniref:hypothetical protein n=1 Tax=Halalkalicoccus sp. GCM10025704 TaxID=3252662 RepID=UPI00361D00EF
MGVVSRDDLLSFEPSMRSRIVPGEMPTTSATSGAQRAHRHDLVGDPSIDLVESVLGRRSSSTRCRSLHQHMLV